MRNLPVILIVTLVSGFSASCTYSFHTTACEYPVAGPLIKHLNLDSTLRESSGLLYLNGHIWTFNDSGGEAALYCIGQERGRVIRKIMISNASNVDWEDICMDDRHIYVADVGNNLASRETVNIYRIPRSRVLSGEPAIDHNGVITLTFDEQMEKTRSGFSSHDCEAIFAHGDSLYLFSKDWVNRCTSVYVIPSEPGHYYVKRRYVYHARVLITGADLYPEEKRVVLLGYRDALPVVIQYAYQDDPGQIICGGKARIYPLKAGRQVEGICFDAAGGVYISSEKSLQKQALFKLGRSLHSP